MSGEYLVGAQRDALIDTTRVLLAAIVVFFIKIHSATLYAFTQAVKVIVRH